MNASAQTEGGGRQVRPGDRQLEEPRPDRGAGHRRSDWTRSCATLDVAFTSSAGLPRRPWFKHQIYAPGYYTGYGVKTLPGVREAIEQHAWSEAEAQAAVTAEAIGRAADVLDRATAIVAGP